MPKKQTVREAKMNLAEDKCQAARIQIEKAIKSIYEARDIYESLDMNYNVGQATMAAHLLNTIWVYV